MNSDEVKQIFVKLCCCKLNVDIDVMDDFLFVLEKQNSRSFSLEFYHRESMYL